MGVELTTSNLRNLCRICLGEGEYNLWEHKVSCSNVFSPLFESEGEAANFQYADNQELTVHEVLQMYNDWQYSILELDNELQLICKACLDELQPHFTYYRRLQAANKQLKQLYKQAQEQEQTTAMQDKAIIIENVVCENSCTEYADIVQENIKSYEQNMAEPVEQIVFTEKIIKDQLITRPSTKYAQKRKFAKNPKFILTGGVTQLLAHATKGGTSCASTILSDVAQLAEMNYPCSPQKRKRTEDVDGDVPLLIVDEKIIHDFYRQDYVEADNAATSKCKSKYERVEEYDNIQEVVHELPPDKILTVDDEYAMPADELNNINQVEGNPQNQDEETQQQFDETKQHHEEVQKQQPNKGTDHSNTNDELTAAILYSTLIADEAGRSIYVCKYCPQAFTAPCFLMTHARNSHACKYCNKSFVKTPDLFAHIKDAHNEHKCTVCGKELSSNGNLRAHMKRMHRLKSSAGSTQSTDRTKYSTNTAKNVIKESRGTVEQGKGGCDVVYIDENNQIIPAEYLE